MKNLQKIIEIASKAEVNVAAWGRHGIGKTAVIESLRNNGFFVKTLILSQVDPLVLGGYPGRSRFNGNTITDFAKPLWLCELEEGAKNSHNGAILFLDEFNRADRYAHAAAMRLVQEREINGYKLPKRLTIVAAMNPEDSGDSDVLQLTDPMINRWCHVPVHSNADVWLTWARSAKLNEMVTGFIATKPDRLNGWSMDGLFEQQVLSRIKPTERSVHAVARILDVVGMENVKSSAVYAMIRGLCGTEWAAEFMAYVEDAYAKPFEVEEMMEPSENTLKRVKSLIDKGQTQVLIVSLEKMRVEAPKRKLDAKALKGFWKFLVACPVDIQTGFWYHEADKMFWNVMLVNKYMPKEVLAALAK